MERQLTTLCGRRRIPSVRLLPPDALLTTTRSERLFEGNAVEATWDEALTTAMKECGVAIAEEGLAATLLQDLAD
jgi:hypothetical protein